jgi:ubiquinone/menaquinone biosynthesis C-methylase UbiE
MGYRVAFTKYEKQGAYHWDLLAQRFPTSYSARLHAQYGWFVREARRRKPALTIDIGCGDAALTHRIREATGGRVVGIEPEPRGVELAREALERAGSGAEVIQGRGEDLPFDDGEAALVTLSEVVEHIEDPEPLVEEAARVLRSDGALLLSTPQWQSPDLRPYHVHEFRADELDELCRRHFADARVFVSEPPRLYDAYLGRPAVRTAVNLLSLAGVNPFRIRVPARDSRRRWRELYAVASRPLG